MKRIFDPRWPLHITRNGHLVKLIAADLPGEQPILGLLYGHSFEDPALLIGTMEFSADGTFFIDGRESVFDLFNVDVSNLRAVAGLPDESDVPEIFEIPERAEPEPRG